MRILIDECLDWRLCRALTEHHCVSVARMGWAGLTNGLLLERAEDEFDVFVTIDSNLSFQQNLTKFHIAVIVLEARSTRLVDTMSLMPQLTELLPTSRPGEVVRIRSKS
jgi:predicted nuclease of predicted toxin-antitoxin system